MPNERAIICGNAPHTNLPFEDAKPVQLRLWGPHQNVTLCIDDIRRCMLSDIPSQFLDLIEIATYIYCADQAVTRGGDGVDNLGENWRRRLYLRIPVRNPDLWSSSDLQKLMGSTLGFLSEDEYLFDFTKLEKGPPIQQYLKFSDEDVSPGNLEEVVLYSGGLDSLGGAIQEAVVDKRKVALITHKPTRKLEKRYRHLNELLSKHSQNATPIYIPVSINKGKALSREYTQRSRSFLYAALGSTIAQMIGLSRIRFYENGIVSFNLPPSAQVVGAKATRTTHPQAINGFAQILTAVANKRFTVENPFLWLTKTEVLELIEKAGCSELIKFATSCAHTWEITKLKTHCGKCSQCIDRRFAVLAAGLEEHDPKEMYKVDLLEDERDEGEPRTMLAAYVETASEITRMSPVEFFSRYGEASRVLRHLDGSPDTTAMKLFELHQRHAKQVTKVIDDAIAKYSSAIRERKLAPTCLLRLVCDSAAASPGAVSIQPEKEFVGTTPILKDYVFRKKGQAWIVRYAGGEDFILLPCKGAAYLHILLSNPRATFPVTKLAFTVAKEPEMYALGDAGVASDRDALSAYRVTYEDLKGELEEARENSDLAQEERIQNEMDWLAQQIKRDQGLGGRLRKEADDRDRVRKSFQAAIRRVVKEISKYDKRLAEHFKPPRLTCGRNPCYDPQDDIEWDT